MFLRTPYQASQNFDFLSQGITNLSHDFSTFRCRNLDKKKEKETDSKTKLHLLLQTLAARPPFTARDDQTITVPLYSFLPLNTVICITNQVCKMLYRKHGDVPVPKRSPSEMPISANT